MKIVRTESGFTLLEGMIATVILSVGVIAMGAMQGIAITRNVDSTELTLATNMASEMLERIQYNRRNVTAYAGIDTNNPCVLPAIQTMAQGDCVQWQAMMTNQGASGISQASMLTGVRGVVTVNSCRDHSTAESEQSECRHHVDWAKYGHDCSGPTESDVGYHHSTGVKG